MFECVERCVFVCKRCVCLHVSSMCPNVMCVCVCVCMGGGMHV